MADSKKPLHVAIIMDGNGRWAKDRGMPRLMGHRQGVKTVKNIVSHAAGKGVSCLSLFAFSTENWLRPKEEVKGLMKLLDEYIGSELQTLQEQNVKLVVSGRIEGLPDGIRAKLEELIADTADNDAMVLNLALNYGGQAEIADAMKLIAADVAEGKLSAESINEKTIAEYLYNSDIPDIDLLIRTSGEMRISNFMLWRIAYSELYFTDTLWPAFDEAEFDKALDDFNNRRRRFGKTDEQLSSA